VFSNEEIILPLVKSAPPACLSAQRFPGNLSCTEAEWWHFAGKLACCFISLQLKIVLSSQIS